MRLASRKGVTLLETILALSLLSGTLLVVAALMDSGLGLSRDSRLAAQSAVVARARLSQVRAAFDNVGQFQAPSSLPGHGSWQTYPDFPGFETRVTVAPFETFTPNRVTELLHDVADRRTLNHSVLRADVEVRGGRSAQVLRLSTLIAEPRQFWRGGGGHIVIHALDGDTAGHAAELRFDAEGFDNAGRRIEDLMLTWAVIPGTSCGIIRQQDRNGHSCIFVHQVPKPGRPDQHTYAPPGNATIKVSGRLWGVERSTSYEVHLL